MTSSLEAGEKAADCQSEWERPYQSSTIQSCWVSLLTSREATNWIYEMLSEAVEKLERICIQLLWSYR